VPPLPSPQPALLFATALSPPARVGLVFRRRIWFCCGCTCSTPPSSTGRVEFGAPRASDSATRPIAARVAPLFFYSSPTHARVTRRPVVALSFELGCCGGASCSLWCWWAWRAPACLRWPSSSSRVELEYEYAWQALHTIIYTVQILRIVLNSG